ncbi:MAG: TetR/AcrR family transcriptional regulator [Eggerthellaceae bacterium]|nr:TetR/AcrR family transcriptional regulator [Eggerthellaceae bacterium]
MKDARGQPGLCPRKGTGKNSMSRGTDTREALLKSGTAEFLAHGFERASLRVICANAHVTTGAFYAHFKKKEDLFCAIVQDDLTAYLGHYDSLMERMRNNMQAPSDNEVEIMDYLVERRDLFRLLFDCSAGTKYEGFKERLIAHFEKSYQDLFDAYAEEPVDHDIVCVVVKMKFAQYMELLYGDYSKERVREIMERLQGFTQAGFEALTGTTIKSPG